MNKNEQKGKSATDATLIQVDGFGARLKLERERVGMSPGEFGQLAEVNRVTQVRYELEANFPTVVYLSKLRQHGIDTHFLLTGIPAKDIFLLDDAEAFCKALELVDALATNHNFQPSAEFKARAIVKVYLHVKAFGSKRVSLSLEELLNDRLETQRS